MKMKLNFSAMAYLVAELTKNEMWAIYVMGCGKEMPDQVTKSDLVRIIHVLCKKLDWIEVDQVEALTLSSGEGKTVNSFDFSSSRVSEPAIGNSPETGLVSDNSLSGSKTVNNGQKMAEIFVPMRYIKKTMIVISLQQKQQQAMKIFQRIQMC